MTSFLDGPASGKQMMLRRAPHFLRVTQRRFSLRNEGTSEEFDALDQLADVAKNDETLHAYVKAKDGGGAMVDFRGKERHRSGYYPISTYQYVTVQPTDATMRDNAKWAEWCKQQPKP